MQTVSDAFNIDDVILRAAELDDAEGLTTLGNLPGVRNGTLRVPFQSVASTRKMLENTPSTDCRILAIWQGQVIGWCGLYRLKGREHHVAEIGIGVHDDFAGKGIGGKLLSAIIDTADNWLNISRIQLYVNVDNHHAIKLYERFGFQHEGTLRSLTFRNGEYVDGHIMARLREEQPR
jgi:putative acetyltransferase